MKVICIDDERLSLDFLEKQLEELDDVSIQATFTNPFDGLEYILKEDIDLAFLDIQMPNLNGIQLAEKILEEKPYVVIIFVTAYNEFAVEAFQLNALDYIVKPTTHDRLNMTLKRAKKEIDLYAKEKQLQKEHLLHIKLTPFLAFADENNEFKPLQWRTRKAEELFVYLLQNSNVLIEKSSLIELLWGNYDIERSYALLYTTIYNVRKQLKQYHKHIKLTNRSDGYILELDKVEVDIFTWEKEIASLSPVSEETIEDYETVMELNDGVYLEHYDYIWLESEKHRLNSIWMRTASQMANYYRAASDWKNSIKWFNDIIERYPTTEEAHFNLMKMYEKNGDFTLMMKQYSELNKALRKELEGRPSDFIVEWYVDKLK